MLLCETQIWGSREATRGGLRLWPKTCLALAERSWQFTSPHEALCVRQNLNLELLRLMAQS